MRTRNHRRNLALLLLLGLVSLLPGAARAAATAQGVALNANASCTNADLDLTLTTVGAQREFGQATNLAGQIVPPFEQATPFLGTFSGTFIDYQIPNSINPMPPQAAGTLIGSYAYVGTTPPSSSTTAATRRGACANIGPTTPGWRWTARPRTQPASAIASSRAASRQAQP